MTWNHVERWVDMSCRALVGVPGFRGAVLVFRDVTEFEELRIATERAATTDWLTGAANRQALMGRLRELAADGATGTVMVLDMDRFKEINDVHGHAVGDLLLVHVVGRVKALVPAGGLLARLGGDEFVVVLPGVDVSETVDLVADLRAAVVEPVTLGGVPVATSVTVGMSVLGANVDASLVAADRDMYLAKARRGETARDIDLRTWRERAIALVQENENLKHLNERLREESRTDDGTGLPNRRQLLADLDAMHQRAMRSRRPYTVVFLDLDRFGLLNHHLGDDVGDATLLRVARTLTAALRSGEQVYRKGGEELVVLLSDTDLAGGEVAAERYRAAIDDERIPHGGHPDSPTLTVSLGVATGPEPGRDARHALAQSGLCMLTAKKNGRNRTETTPQWVPRGEQPEPPGPL